MVEFGTSSKTATNSSLHRVVFIRSYLIFFPAVYSCPTSFFLCRMIDKHNIIGCYSDGRNVVYDSARILETIVCNYVNI